MSPNDVCIIDELEDLIDAGIDSFKIDGILKSVEYMTEVTAMYREAIDLCIAGKHMKTRKNNGSSGSNSCSLQTAALIPDSFQRNSILKGGIAMSAVKDKISKIVNGKRVITKKPELLAPAGIWKN